MVTMARINGLSPVRAITLWGDTSAERVWLEAWENSEIQGSIALPPVSRISAWPAWGREGSAACAPAAMRRAVALA